MRIVITGATGFIGTRLAEMLRDAGHEIVTLGRGASANYRWDATGDAPAEAFEGAGVVVHLAGEPVAQKWTAE
jgi:nucleoside-diphosphate-sugar epimerase